MKTKILVSLVMVLFFAACNKDKFNTTPTLKLISVSSNVIPNGGTLRIEVQVTDKEGDISDTLYLKKIRTNKIVRATIRDSLQFAIPQADKIRDGIIQLDLQYQNHLVSAFNPGNPPVNDTLNLQIAVRDQAKNRSEPLTISNIVVIR
jgi:hypothetical protein